ncbi:DUF475 domain-containing protein, partial [Acinetobacter baumannii]
DEDKEVHWLRWIETQLARASGIKAAEIAVLLVALYALSRLLAPAEALTFLGAGLLGIVAFIAVEAVGTILEQREAAQRAAGAVVRSGLGGFL